MEDMREPRPPATPRLSICPLPGPGPREIAAIAGTLVSYVLDLYEQALPGHSVVMLLRDAVCVLGDEDENEQAYRVASSPRDADRSEGGLTPSPGASRSRPPAPRSSTPPPNDEAP